MLVWRGVILDALFRALGKLEARRQDIVVLFFEEEEGGTGKSPLLIPRETGRGLSISGAHRVTAVERFVGATLVVALPRTAPPSARHCLGTTGPGGWSGGVERRLSSRRLGSASGAASGAKSSSAPTGTGVRSGVVLGADWDRRPSGRREWRRGAATQPGDDATPGGTHKGCPYDHRGLEVSKKSPTAGPPA